MNTDFANLAALPRELGDGLVLRRSTPADADRLAEFNIRIHSEDEPDQRIGVWTRDLLTGNHPTFGANDFLIVERSADAKIISSSNLISQTWTYNGIPFGVGRPELVGTDPEYRRRGLVRLQMDVLHAWSQARGELVQAITGIPNYYRQFGYEMTVDLDGGWFLHYAQYKPLAEGEHEDYVIRPAADGDVPVLMQAYAHVEQRQALSCARTAKDWLYELTGKDQKNIDHVELFVIEETSGQPVGAVGVKCAMWQDGLPVQFYGLLPGYSYLMVTPGVLRFLWRLGQEWVGEGKTCTRLVFLLGGQHPARVAFHPRMISPLNPYAYYMRVADLPGFLRLITPVLEQRLAQSPCAGHSGELRLNFFRGGLMMKLEKGRLNEIGKFAPRDGEDGEAFFPGLSFLQLLFQSRSLYELRDFYADCSAKVEAQALLDAMFPCNPSTVWPIS